MTVPSELPLLASALFDTKKSNSRKNFAIDLLIDIFLAMAKKRVVDGFDLDDLANLRPAYEERFLISKIAETSRNLKVLRAVTRLTSKELAELSSVSHSLIRAVENGHRILHVGNALVIALHTGVDPCSLLFGKVLLEWGGACPYTEETFKEWVERGKNPTEKQEANGHRQLRNLCAYSTENLNAGHTGDALLTSYLLVLLEGLGEEVLYAGIEK